MAAALEEASLRDGDGAAAALLATSAAAPVVLAGSGGSGKAWSLGEPHASWLRVQLLQLCCRFFFDHLIRLNATLLEPHLGTASRGWVVSLETACTASLPSALWALHALLEPRTITSPDTSLAEAAEAAEVAEAPAPADAPSPSESTTFMGPLPEGGAPPCDAVSPTVGSAHSRGGGSGAGCWLLAALFDCQSAVARGAIVGFATSLVQRVGTAEGAVAAAAARDGSSAASGSATPLAPPLHGHVSAFVRSLLSVGLAHAAKHWGDALPYCDLIRSLILLPPPLGPQLAEAWLAHGALPSLAAYVIGECALELPAHLGEPIMEWPRPQRGAQPTRTTDVSSNNEGTVLLLEAIAVLMDAQAGYAAGAAAAAAARVAMSGEDGTAPGEVVMAEVVAIGTSVVGEGGVAWPAERTAAPVVTSAVTVEVGDDPLSGGDAGSINGGAIVNGVAVTGTAHPPPAANDLVCSAPFVSGAVAACVRAGAGVGSEASEPLFRCLERGCRHSSDRSSVVLKEALRGLRHEGEHAAGLCAQLVLHLLARVTGDELLPLRMSMALKRQEGGLIGLAIELMQATPPDAPRPAEEATGAATERAAPWNESTRCYLCITTLLEVHASSAVAAAWLEDVLVGEEVDAMLRWLKEASRTAALGRAVERARLLGVVRRGGRYERTESQQTALEQLRGLQRAVAAKAKAAARR